MNTTTTTNYGLGKPEADELYDIEVMNSNMDAIDAKMKENEEHYSSVEKSISDHVANESNPQGVTKSQVGLSNVPNVSTNNQTPTYSVSNEIAELESGEKLSAAFGKIAKAISTLISHLSNESNPHVLRSRRWG